MYGGSLVLAAIALGLLPNAATACEAIKSTESPLEIQTPLLSTEGRVLVGFGIRNHPILNTPRMHVGVDWQAPAGTPVVAVGQGRVIAVAEEGAYGNRVIIDHGGAWHTLYGHLESFAVDVGDCVAAGTVIGAVGMTGMTAEPLVHFEVRCEGQPIDPLVLAAKPKPSSPIFNLCNLATY